MKKVRFGIVGVKGIGRNHADSILKSGGRDCSLAAVADIVPEVAASASRELGVPGFADAREMFASGLCEAVIIATPHYWHAPLTIRAARAGLQVLCEKPLDSTVGRARAMIAECRKRKIALGTMLQHRTRGIMIKARQLVQSGRLGEVFRVQMVCSDWFRTQAYYDQGEWRGTWSDEGGGVLINQAPHHLDLFQWIGGMPRHVMAVLNTRAHDIDVEDTANVLFEYDRGKVGYLYATTAEEPGYEQIMISGDKATMIVQDGKIRLGKLKVPVSRHIARAELAQQTTWREVRIPGRDGGHIGVIRNFARHVRTGEPLIGPASEGINELELSNAAYLAGFLHKRVTLPVDAKEMERLLARLERGSSGPGEQLRKKSRQELNKLLRRS